MTNPENNNTETPAPAAAQTVEPAVQAATAPVEIPIPEVTHKNDHSMDPGKLGILSDVSILLTIEVGRAHIKIRDLLNLTKGSVLELDKLAGDPVDIYANGKLISTGNIITANGKYCVRLTSIPENSKLGMTTDGK